MTQSVAQKTLIPEKTWRRHTDSPTWWIAFSCGSVILHLLAFWLLSLYELNSSRVGFGSAVPIEFIEISPQKLSSSQAKPKPVSPKPAKSIIRKNSQPAINPRAVEPPISRNDGDAIAFDINKQIKPQSQQQSTQQRNLTEFQRQLEARQRQLQAERQRQLEAQQRLLAEQLRQREAEQRRLEAQIRQQEAEQQRRLAEQQRLLEAQQRQQEAEQKRLLKEQRQREAEQQRHLEQQLRQKERLRQQEEEEQKRQLEAQRQQKEEERKRQLEKAQLQKEADERKQKLVKQLRQVKSQPNPISSVIPPGQPGGRVLVGEGTSLEELAQPNDGEQQAGTAIARWQVEADEHQQKQDTITPTGGNLPKPLGNTREKKLSLPSLNAANSQPIQFQASLIIDSFGNLNDVWVNPAIKEPQRSQYRKYVMEIFQGVKFKPAQNSNGSKPPLSNLVVRINIEQEY